jgi:hypothetical protein
VELLGHCHAGEELQKHVACDYALDVAAAVYDRRIIEVRGTSFSGKDGCEGKDCLSV